MELDVPAHVLVWSASLTEQSSSIWPSCVDASWSLEEEGMSREEAFDGWSGSGEGFATDQTVDAKDSDSLEAWFLTS
ncbi:hypothetical protein LTR27_001001 [Elasticomyces elasticus]|nr:hypothetical protein LTR27_001001 [Elasticomyces elasticus]